MGIETAILIGTLASGAFSASQSIKNAKSAANATIAEGNIATANKAKEVQMRAARQKSSFLNSGLTLEGTPENVIDSTFSTGLTDLNQLSSNYNTKAKQQIAEGRAQAISSIASSFAGASFAGAGASAFKAGSFGLQTGGQSLFNGGMGNIFGSLNGAQGPGF
jgi:endo-beta-N-acetylglucosaminidase D